MRSTTINSDKDPGPPVCEPPFCDTGGNIDTGSLPENEVYFFHPDHLGSTSYITNISGETVQFNSYLPFGESFVSQKRTSTISNYLFNGKEKDMETQNSYYGARYYNSELSIWLSVDRPINNDYLGSKPSETSSGGVFQPKNLSVYSFGWNNPINRIDFRGDSIIVIGNNASFEDAKKILTQTKSGQKLWDKYANSDTDDIYIGFGKLDDDYTSGGTKAFINTEKNTDSNGNWKNNSRDPNMKPLEGVNMSSSIKRKANVHMMVLNNSPTARNRFGFNENGDRFELAETIYHEIKAHIDVFNSGYHRGGIPLTPSNFDADMQHELYGDTGSGIKSNSYYGGEHAKQIANELLQLKYPPIK